MICILINIMAQPRLSVIVSAYNSGDKVLTALNSVAGQNFPGLEIVIVNDGSLDSTPQKIGDFIKNHQTLEIKFVNLGKNSGLMRARYEGFSASSGNFVAFLDADDRFNDDSLLKIVKMSAELKCDLCHFDEVYQFFGDSVPRNIQHAWANEVQSNDIFRQGHTMHGKLFSRSILDRVYADIGQKLLQTHIVYLEDFLICGIAYSLTQNGYGKYAKLEIQGYIYAQNDDSAQSNLQLLKEFSDIVSVANILSSVFQRYSNHYSEIAKQNCQNAIFSTITSAIGYAEQSGEQYCQLIAKLQMFGKTDIIQLESMVFRNLKFRCKDEL